MKENKQEHLFSGYSRLPEDSTVSSKMDPSSESRSGAPYHFLNFGPPTPIQLR